MLQQFDERNRDLIVSIGGRLVHRDEAGVSPFDSAVQGGDAVWEGLRLYEGRIFKLIEHLDRLRSSAKALAFAVIPAHETIIGEIRRTLEANGMSDGVHIRLTLTRGVKYTSGMDPRLNTAGPTLIASRSGRARPPCSTTMAQRSCCTRARTITRPTPPAMPATGSPAASSHDNTIALPQRRSAPALPAVAAARYDASSA